MEINAFTVIGMIVCTAGWYFLLTEGARLFNRRKGSNR